MRDEVENELFFIIGTNIRTCRKNAGLSQSVLSTQVGLSRTSLVSIEQGKQHPSVYMLWKIAETLNVEIRELLPSRIQVSTANKGIKATDDAFLFRNEQSFDIIRQFVQGRPTDSTESP